MSTARFFGIAVMVGLCTAWSLADSAADDVQRLVKEGQYAQALQKIAATMAQLKPGAHAEKYQLLMLKGECHLQSKAATLAADAFNAAAREARDDSKESIAAAHALLVKKSSGLVYKAKSGTYKGQPLDITRAEVRKQAFTALYEDEQKESDRTIELGRKAKSLLPVIDALKETMDLHGLEVAATGKSDKTASLLVELSDHAKTLITDALRDMEKRVDTIDKDANELQQRVKNVSVGQGKSVRQRQEIVWRKKGLNTRQTDDLREIAATCQKIDPAIDLLQTYGKGQNRSLESLSDQAKKIQKDVKRLLDTDYSREYQHPPK